MSQSTFSHQCPTCGTPLPVNAPEGLCPKCLLAAVAHSTGEEADTGSPKASAPKVSEIAPCFPHLEIIECLGRGGMGIVYKARQPQLDRFVALKILAPERVTESRFAERFQREAQALASLSHPNIVTIHDFGKADPYFYLIMEYMDGVNLRQLLRAGRLAPEEALAIVPDICDALQYAHDHGIVHRDIKPENLLLNREGRVKIADFGIARMLGMQAGETSPSPPGSLNKELPAGKEVSAGHTVAGTPQYMAPEQSREPDKADHRADLYSLGVVLYEMLTGELPEEKLQPPSSRLKGIQLDVRLDEIVLRALEKKPERRYQTATEFRTRIEEIGSKEANRQGKEELPRTVPSTPGTSPNKSRLLAISAVLFYAGLLVGLPLVALLVKDALGTVALGAALIVGVPWLAYFLESGLERKGGTLRLLGVMGLLLSIPAVGFGVFFLTALLSESGGWHPSLQEAMLVPLTWLGSLLLPWSAWRLLRAGSAGSESSGNLGPSPNPWPRRIFWLIAGVMFVPPALFLLYLLVWLVSKEPAAVHSSPRLNAPHTNGNGNPSAPSNSNAAPGLPGGLDKSRSAAFEEKGSGLDSEKP